MKNYVQLEIPFATEEWKDIEGYEGLYQVSDLGRVKSLGNNQTRKEKILKPATNKDRYLWVTLYKNNKKKAYLVHRLVAQAFISNDDPEHKTQINHKSEEKWLNTVDNLEWCTPKENVNWGTGIERCHQKLINHPNMSKPVKQLALDGTLVAVWASTMEAERNGFNQVCICACCNGKYKTHKGYKWKYA